MKLLDDGLIAEDEGRYVERALRRSDQRHVMPNSLHHDTPKNRLPSLRSVARSMSATTGASSMSPDLRPIVASRFRTPNGQTWAEVHVALRFNDLKGPPPSIIVRFPYSASEELNNAPDEMTKVILKVAGDRLIQLFKDAAAELERKPLELGWAYVSRGPSWLPQGSY
jgi:hypothetical protein